MIGAMNLLAPLIGSIQLTSGIGVVISIIVLGSLFVLWLFSLFLLITDSISAFAKVIWAILLICIAPLAIPVYLILHHRRYTHAS
jgi:hypothetical protein